MDMNPEATKIQRIKDLLCEWAALAFDRYGTGYPKECAFATERVQSSNRSTDTYYEAWPAIITRLNDTIEAMPPKFKQIVRIEYFDKRPQKVKAEVLQMTRQIFNQRLAYIYEHLDHVIYGCPTK